MTKDIRFLRWLLPAALCFATGLWVSAVWDLSINLAVYNPHSLFAVLMEAFCWYPAFLPALWLAALLCTQPQPFSLPHRLASGAVAVLGLGILCFASGHSLVHRNLLAGWRNPTAFLWLACALALGAVLFRLVQKTTFALREKLFLVAGAGSIFLLANQGIVQVLKWIWQRTRFDEMVSIGSFSNFTPWFLPFGAGGNSFPSGHTANAAGVFFLLFLCDVLPAWHKRRPLVLAGCWVFIALTSFSRVLIGRHFLSDTLASAAISALLFWTLHSSRLYRRRLRAVLQHSALPTPTGDTL